MQVTAEQTDPCTIVLNIAVDEQQVARAFDNAYREFGRYTSVPGFRPGKAPRAVLERFVNAERVREHTLEKIVTDSYSKAIEEQGLTPYRRPEIAPSDLEDKKPYTYRATVPLEPQVTLGEYTGLTIQKPIFPVTDAMVEERLERARSERARLERVTDRGVQPGDVLIAENQVVLEGEENPPSARRQLIQVGNNIPGFDEAILGLMPDEERTFTLTYPEDYDEETRRGKQATFTVRLSSISAKKLPELDEEFAKQVAHVETVEDLRRVTRERLEAEMARLSDQVAERLVLEEILNHSEVYFPEILVREEVEENLRQLLNELREGNYTYEQYLAQSGRTQEQHLAEMHAQAETQIRAVLALRQIALQEELRADDADIDAQIDRMFSEGRLTEEQQEEFRREPRRRLQVANALIQQKLHDFLFAHNTFNEVEQTTAPTADELAEAAEAE